MQNVAKNMSLRPPVAATDADTVTETDAKTGAAVGGQRCEGRRISDRWATLVYTSGDEAAAIRGRARRARGRDNDPWAWLRRHHERAYSFVDATSFALMRSLRIREALAFDGDFAAAGSVELRA